VLLSSLTNLSVSHFEIDSLDGDPRSLSIQFAFSPHEYFADGVLEKRFWYRRGRNGWSGLVSEPVRIQWKKDRDLTGGLLDMVCAAYGVSKSVSSKSGGLSTEQMALKKKIEGTGMGGLSFFAWFGFIGRHISAGESREASRVERERREVRDKERREGRKIDVPVEEEADEDADEDDVGMSLEIFPDGEDLAIAIAEDLWPSAIKYFTQAQEQDALSDADFESDEGIDEVNGDSEDASEGDGDAEPPAKKRRSS